jgi:hypothetical protein
MKKRSTIEQLKTFSLSREENETISPERYNKELEETEAEFEKRDYITHEEMRKQISEW